METNPTVWIAQVTITLAAIALFAWSGHRESERLYQACQTLGDYVPYEDGCIGPEGQLRGIKR